MLFDVIGPQVPLYSLYQNEGFSYAPKIWVINLKALKMKVGSHGEVFYFTAHPAWKNTLSQHSSVLKCHFPQGEKTSRCFVQPAHRQCLWFWEFVFATIKSQKQLQDANKTEIVYFYEPYILVNFGFNKSLQALPSWELTYPTLGKGKPSPKVPWDGIC